MLENSPSLNQIFPDAPLYSSSMMRALSKICAHCSRLREAQCGAPPTVSPLLLPRAPLPPRPRSPGPRDRVHSLLPPLNREKPPLNERTTRDGPAPSRASMTWCRIGRAASFSRRMALTAVRGFSSNPLTVVRYQPVSQGLTTRPELSPPQRLAGPQPALSRALSRGNLFARGFRSLLARLSAAPQRAGDKNSTGRLSPKANSHSFHEVPKKHLERRNNGCMPGVRHDFDPPSRHPFPSRRGESLGGGTT